MGDIKLNGYKDQVLPTPERYAIEKLAFLT